MARKRIREPLPPAGKKAHYRVVGAKNEGLGPVQTRDALTDLARAALKQSRRRG